MNSSPVLARDGILEGTVAFPMPFPSLARISFEIGENTDHTMPELAGKDVVVLQEVRDKASVRQIMARDKVSAVFVPGARDEQETFHISAAPHATDLESGEWFFGPDINSETLRTRLNLRETDDVSTRNSVLRGIVFLGESLPVLSVTEVGATAGTVEFERRQLHAGCARCFR